MGNVWLATPGRPGLSAIRKVNWRFIANARIDALKCRFQTSRRDRYTRFGLQAYVLFGGCATDANRFRQDGAEAAIAGCAGPVIGI
jgi:hypothetical protein